jgi:uncharacterized damage-inducible protein DinB
MDMEIYRDVLEPVGGVSPGIGFYLAGMEEVRAQLREIVADISVEELSARILPEAHQMGGLLLHIGETEWWWICSIAGGEAITEPVKMLYYLDDTVETDFALKGLGAADCIAFLDRVRAASLVALAKFADADLDEMTAYEANGKHYESSLRWILHHVMEHEAHHKGQVAMMKRLIREGKL